MTKIACRFRRTLLLALCLLLAAAPALAEGVRFTIRADIDPVQYASDLRPLMTGLAALLDDAVLEGALVTDSGCFELDAAMTLGSGQDACVTSLRLYGLDSHVGLESSLLGGSALMINSSALLPFGLKARDYTSLPLDTAALLAPYTHVSALQPVAALLAPLFPDTPGSVTLSPAELDALIADLQTLCEENTALNHWLEATELYGTVDRFCRAYFALPEALHPALTIERTDTALTWLADSLPILTLTQQENTTAVTFTIPTMAEFSATLRDDRTFITGSMHADVDGTKADLSFSLPTALPCALPAFYLTLDAESPLLPEEGLRLVFEGESHGNAITIRQLRPEHTYTMMTLTATLTPFTPDTLPAYTPESLTGVNILSVNGDSLRELLVDVREPLLTGLFDLLVAAPPEAVQALMDVLEDAGVVDLITDSLSGGFAY